MKRVFIFVIMLALSLVGALSQSVAGATTKVLSYRFDRDGMPFTVLATSFSGICNVTVKRSTANGVSEKTAPMDAATFAELMEGVSQIHAISSARLSDGSPTVDTETHHIITTLDRSDAGSKSEMYGVPDKEAPETFRAWVKLLLDAIPQA
jgi:hypothetical protein